LDGYSAQKEELDKLGVKVVAASVDDIENAKKIADQNNFDVAYGVTKDIADTLGSWWEERRQIIQPSEFVINSEGKVMVSSYSDGPLGRIDAGDVIKLINFYESQKK
jgi:peroxiredoxin